MHISYIMRRCFCTCLVQTGLQYIMRMVPVVSSYLVIATYIATDEQFSASCPPISNTFETSDP